MGYLGDSESEWRPHIVSVALVMAGALLGYLLHSVLMCPVPTFAQQLMYGATGVNTGWGLQNFPVYTAALAMGDSVKAWMCAALTNE